MPKLSSGCQSSEDRLQPEGEGQGSAWDSFVRVAQRSASASRPGRTASEKREMRHWTRRHRQVEGHEKRGPRWRRRFGVMMSRGARQPKQQNGWVGSKREAQGGDDGSSDTGWGWLGSDRLSPFGAGFLACRKDGHTLFSIWQPKKKQIRCLHRRCSVESVDVHCPLKAVISTQNMEFKDLN